MRTILVFLLLCSTACAADLTFEVRDGATTGAGPALATWKASTGATGSNWWLWGVTTWDQNGDGKPDILVTSHNSSIGSTILRQSSGLNFTDVTSSLGLTRPQLPNTYTPFVGDIDANGYADLATYFPKCILNNGVTLTQSTALPSTTQLMRLANPSGQFPNITWNQQDLLWGHNIVVTLTNRFGLVPPNPLFVKTVAEPPYPTGLPQSVLDQLAVFVADTATANRYCCPRFVETDIDGDGDQDCLVVYDGCYANAAHRRTWICLRNAGGVLQDATAASGLPTLAATLPIHDLTGDGKPDLLMYGGVGAGLWKQNGGVTFTQQGGTIQTLLTGTASIAWPPQVEYRDFDNDGDLDFLVSLVRSNKCEVYEQVAGGITRRIQTSHWNGFGFHIADMDNDGLLDVVIGGPTAGYPADYENADLTIFHNTTAATPPPQVGVLRVRINGEEQPGATVQIDGVMVSEPTGSVDKVIDVTVP